MLKTSKIAFFTLLLQISTAAHAEIACRSLFDTPPSQILADDSVAPKKQDSDILPSDYGRASRRATLRMESAGLIYSQRENYAGYRLGGFKTDPDGNPIDFTALGQNLFRHITDEVKTSADYDLEIAQYYVRSNDAHTSITLNSSWVKTSPLQFFPADEDTQTTPNFVISFVNSSFQTPTGVRPPQPGDLIVAINDQSIDDFRKQKSANGNYTLPQLLLVGKETSAKILFGLGSRTAKESRGNDLIRLGDKIKYTIQPRDGGKAYDVTYEYQSTGTPLLRQPVTPDAVITSPITQPEVAFKSQPVAPAVPPKTLTESLNQFFFSKLLAAKKAISKRLPAPKTYDSTPLMSETQNPGTYRIFKIANQMMQAEVSHIKKDVKSQKLDGVGVELGMGLQTPFVNFEKNATNFKRIQMPEDPKIPGLRDMFNDNFFYAGTFESEGVRIGVLRIPSYEPTNTDTMLQSLRYFTTRLQAESDVLIIDQTFNPGGLVTFSDMVIRSLVGKFDTSKHLAFAVRPSPRFLDEYKSILEEVRANKDGLLQPEEAIDFVHRFTDEYNKIRLAAELNKVDYNGNDIPNTALKYTDDFLPLSEPLSMTVMSDYSILTLDRMTQKDPVQQELYKRLTKTLGMDLTQDSPLSFYTKKVIFWVNAACFSGGDATPVSYRDYKRGLLVGQDTGGAGGTVEGFQQTGWRDILVKFTSSLMIRAGFTTRQMLTTGEGRVEQVGAKVDIPLLPTSNDVTSGGLDSLKKISRIAVDYAKGLIKGP